uniref:Prokaryotic-type class I peptide chain release factors domain-containing protein n=1 Tax=Setaria digitata TaxID=48799 RepID=A0A915PNP8_9BILA
MFLRCSISLRTNSKIVSGWGPGGQKVNMTRNAVTLKHIPTGIVVRVHQSRLLQENIEIARERLKHAVDRHLNGENSYDAQLGRMERERGERIKRKRATIRELKKFYVQEQTFHSGHEETDFNPVQGILTFYFPGEILGCYPSPFVSEFDSSGGRRNIGEK